MSVLLVFIGLFVLAMIMGAITGSTRPGGPRVGPSIWEWSKWKRHFAAGASPILHYDLYMALPVNEWLTCEQIFEMAPSSARIVWRWQVPRQMNRLVEIGRAECQEGEPLRYRKIEPQNGRPRPSSNKTKFSPFFRDLIRRATRKNPSRS